ncbi:MAG: hypothetical protein RL095_452 [Verrucomicrobiota bacterium]|jgi:DNA invertase Pin-like site-specific DNA recombinase
MKTVRMIGYARVSTEDQHLEMQIEALEKAGVSEIYQDRQSGAKRDRRGLTECLESLATGDLLVVWRIDRLGRSLLHLVEIISELRARGVHFRSLSDGAIDTTSATGELVFHIMGAIAQFERRLIQERVTLGMQSAIRRGKHVGRPGIDQEQKEGIFALMKQGKDIKEISQLLSIKETTVRHHFYKSRNLLLSSGSSSTC